MREVLNSLLLRLRGLSTGFQLLLGALVFSFVLAVLYGFWVWGEGLIVEYRDRKAAAVQAKADEEIKELKAERDAIVTEANVKEKLAEADLAKKAVVMEAQNKIINDAGTRARKAQADIQRIEQEHEEEIRRIPDYDGLSPEQQRDRLRARLKAAGRLP